MTENEKTTSTSCSSSTDSGIIITENTTTFNSNESTTPAADKERHQTKEASSHIQSSTDSENKNNIKIQNFINISKNATGNVHNARTQPSPLLRAKHQSSRNASPTVSIRSTSISIVSIEENAVDSSVVDSDSDFECDAEGVHSNYVVKKLGQQTTYPPNSPDIPNMGKGLTVVSQQISQNESTVGLPPMATNLLNGGLCPTPPQAPTTPQIASMALSNNTDVTIGDKYFYEGPVTIQQFLIDSRDKWKSSADGSGQDNPIFGPNGDLPGSADSDSKYKPNSPPTHRQQQPPPYKTFNRKAIVITGGIIVLTILAGILIVLASTLIRSKVTTGVNIGTGRILHIIARDGWLAQPPTSSVSLSLPVSHVVVAPTQTDVCEVQSACVHRVRYIQTYNIESEANDDIVFNFLIGGDGNVYMGRGWDREGAVVPGYNDYCISVAFIGTFKTTAKPSAIQMNVTKLLLNEGVRLGKIRKDYKLVAATTIDPSDTKNIADSLYDSLKGWPHWSDTW